MPFIIDHQVTPAEVPAPVAGDDPGGWTWSYRVGAAHATGSAMLRMMIVGSSRRTDHSGIDVEGARGEETERTVEFHVLGGRRGASSQKSPIDCTVPFIVSLCHRGKSSVRQVRTRP